jgi:hypothetical protein
MSLQTNLAAAFARLVTACNALATRTQPAGGTVGQVLTKTGAADYASAWQAPAGGGGQQVFTQVLRPTAAGPWMWWVKDAQGNLTDLVVNDGS